MSVDVQFQYISKIKDAVGLNPSLIICSGAAYGDNNYQHIFPDAKILNVDMDPGEGVDCVWNLEEAPPEELLKSCDLFISTSVLEHVKRPWLAANNITKTLKSYGILFITVPWAWEYHGFPSDYWRMSPEALDTLFYETKVAHQTFVTYPDGWSYESLDDIPGIKGQYLSGLRDDGNKVKVRMHPLIQVFQTRQLIQ